MSDISVIGEIEKLEQERCRALMESNLAALADLVGDDLVHVHAGGSVENKVDYLEGVKTRLQFHRVERDGMRVRSYGDMAVATGRLSQSITNRVTGKRLDLEIFTTQVWVRRSGTWKQTSFQGTFLPKP
jgi:hypothetical protein